MPRSLVCERQSVLPHLITVVSRHSRHFGYRPMRCGGLRLLGGAFAADLLDSGTKGGLVLGAGHLLGGLHQLGELEAEQQHQRHHDQQQEHQRIREKRDHGPQRRGHEHHLAHHIHRSHRLGVLHGVGVAFGVEHQLAVLLVHAGDAMRVERAFQVRLRRTERDDVAHLQGFGVDVVGDQKRMYGDGRLHGAGERAHEAVTAKRWHLARRREHRAQQHQQRQGDDHRRQHVDNAKNVFHYLRPPPDEASASSGEAPPEAERSAPEASPSSTGASSPRRRTRR